MVSKATLPAADIGQLVETTVDAFGKHVVIDDGIPVMTDNLVSDAQTRGAPTTCSSSSAVRVGMEGVLGVQKSELMQSVRSSGSSRLG